MFDLRKNKPPVYLRLCTCTAIRLVPFLETHHLRQNKLEGRGGGGGSWCSCHYSTVSSAVYHFSNQERSAMMLQGCRTGLSVILLCRGGNVYDFVCAARHGTCFTLWTDARIPSSFCRIKREKIAPYLQYCLVNTLLIS